MNKLSLLERIERLERIVEGEDTPADLEPRPKTRLGDEFPEAGDRDVKPAFGPRRRILECSTCGDFPVRADLLREHHQIGDLCPSHSGCRGKLRKPQPAPDDAQQYADYSGGEGAEAATKLPKLNPRDKWKLGPRVRTTLWCVVENGWMRCLEDDAEALLNTDVLDEVQGRCDGRRISSEEMARAMLAELESPPEPAPSQPTPLVRLDSLPVGARVLIEATVNRAGTDSDGDTWLRCAPSIKGTINRLYLRPDTLVRPIDPPAAAEPEWETVKGSELREGDRVTNCGIRTVTKGCTSGRLFVGHECAANQLVDPNAWYSRLVAKKAEVAGE